MAIHTVNLVSYTTAVDRWVVEAGPEDQGLGFPGHPYEATVFMVHPTSYDWAHRRYINERPYFLPQHQPYLRLMFDPYDPTNDPSDELGHGGPAFGPEHIEALFLGAIRLDQAGDITTLNVVYTILMEREARTLAGLLSSLLPSVESPDIPPEGSALNRAMLARAQEWLERNDHALGAVNGFVQG